MIGFEGELVTTLVDVRTTPELTGVAVTCELAPIGLTTAGTGTGDPQGPLPHAPLPQPLMLEW